MDWADSPELVEIYISELDERSERLIRGAAELRFGPLESLVVDDLVRDAHTLKGSSHMIGKLDLGTAGAALERAWKLVRDAESIPRVRVLAEAMGGVATLMPIVGRDAGRREDLGAITAELVAILDQLESNPPPAGNDHPPVEPATIPPPDTPNLGGLLASIEHQMTGSVTRVDTGDLYRLINRSVEVGLDADALAELTHVAFEGADPAKLLAAWQAQLERLSSDVAELQAWAVALANVPFNEAVETFPQFVRFLARRLGKEVGFRAEGIEMQVDRQIADLLREPLRHLVVNAIDHGIETPQERKTLGKPPSGAIRLRAGLDDERLVVVVEDDGRGVDWDAVAKVAAAKGLSSEKPDLRSHLFRPGFTTVARPNDFSGSGEGLGMVADIVDQVAGSVTIESRQGEGTRIRLDLPVSVVLQNIVIVASGDQFFGVSEPAVLGTAALDERTVAHGPAGPELIHQSERIPVVSFARMVGVGDPAAEHEALVVNTRSGLVAAAVSEIIDRRRLAVKSLGPILDGNDLFTGAGFLGGGQILVVVDHNRIGALRSSAQTPGAHRPRILVVDDSAGVRQLISATLRGDGFEVEVAEGARAAVRSMARTNYEALVVDYSMPGSSGIELVRALRHAGVKLPIVMVSGVADDDDKAAAWEAGVDAYLDKYDLRQGALTASLRRLLEERAQRRASL